MSKNTDYQIPFDVQGIMFQLVYWSIFFAIIIAAYASALRHTPTPTTEELINQIGHHN